MPAVSFAKDIKPLFRPIDIAHMNGMGVKLDDYKMANRPRCHLAVLTGLKTNSLSLLNGKATVINPKARTSSDWQSLRCRKRIEIANCSPRVERFAPLAVFGIIREVL